MRRIAKLLESKRTVYAAFALAYIVILLVTAMPV